MKCRITKSEQTNKKEEEGKHNYLQYKSNYSKRSCTWKTLWLALQQAHQDHLALQQAHQAHLSLQQAHLELCQ